LACWRGKSRGPIRFPLVFGWDGARGGGGRPQKKNRGRSTVFKDGSPGMEAPAKKITGEHHRGTPAGPVRLVFRALGAPFFFTFEDRHLTQAAWETGALGSRHKTVVPNFFQLAGPLPTNRIWVGGDRVRTLGHFKRVRPKVRKTVGTGERAGCDFRGEQGISGGPGNTAAKKRPRGDSNGPRQRWCRMIVKE